MQKAMGQGPRWSYLMKKTRGQKSHDRVPLSDFSVFCAVLAKIGKTAQNVDKLLF
jgi:hypothetical protein